MYKLLINSEPNCAPCRLLEGFLPVVKSLFPALEIEEVKERVAEVNGYPRSTVIWIDEKGPLEMATLSGFRGGDEFLDFIRAVVR